MMEESGQYEALAAVQDANGRVEATLREQIAELRAERVTALAKAAEAAAEAERLRGRGFFARVFGGRG